MKIGVPSTGPLGDRFEVWTVREPNDPQTTITWTLCIFDSNNNNVFMDAISHTVGTDPDIKSHIEDITNLSDGVYRVNVYYGNYITSGCDNAPADQLKYMFYIHKLGTNIVTLGMDSSWFPDTDYIFTMYVLNGIPFYQSSSSRTVGIPANVDVFVEVTGSDKNAYVGIVHASSDVYVPPNTTIPFRATLTIKLDKPYAQNVAAMYANLLGFGRGVVVNVVDDYTFNLQIVKTEVGVINFVVALLIFGLVALIVWGAVNIMSMVVQLEKIFTIDKIIDERNQVEQQYLSEYNNCGTDQNCINNVRNKYLPLIQAYDAEIGALTVTLQSTSQQCNGFQIGGVCIPWWAIVIAVVFLVVLIAR